MPITEDDAERERQRHAEQKAKAKKRGKGKALKPARKGKNMVLEDTTTDDEGNDEEPDDILDWCAYVNTFDVCITTYNVLQHDLSVARAPPTRPRRDTATYSNTERPRSPLVMCEWYRVIMDEVQMVGGGKTECVFLSIV